MSNHDSCCRSLAVRSGVAGAGVLALGLSMGARAAGSLTYGPAVVTTAAVPIGGGIATLLLAVLLAAIAYRVMSRPGAGAGGGAAMGLALTLGSAAMFVASAAFVYNAEASLSAITLDNPNGDTVPVEEGYQEYINGSGVALAIREIVSPCEIAPAQASLSASAAILNGAPLCVAGSTVLQDGESCTTDFNCTCTCTGRECGDDGCGGSCGECAGDSYCNEEAGRCEMEYPDPDILSR